MRSRCPVPKPRQPRRRLGRTHGQQLLRATWRGSSQSSSAIGLKRKKKSWTNAIKSLHDPLSIDLFSILSLISVPCIASSSTACSSSEGNAPSCRTWNSHKASFENPGLDQIRHRTDQDMSCNEAYTRIQCVKRLWDHVPSNVKIKWGLISFASRLTFRFHCQSSASRSEVNCDLSFRFFPSFLPDRSLKFVKLEYLKT